MSRTLVSTHRRAEKNSQLLIGKDFPGVRPVPEALLPTLPCMYSCHVLSATWPMLLLVSQ